MYKMLNPDGVERWQRRTTLQIDMNRDALRLQCPESRILKNLQQTLKPLVGFNLHDQSPRYSVGNTKEVAAISFLATAYNHERTINSVRERAMQLIVGMVVSCKSLLPNQVARYSDEFEPRAFGDNIAKWGTSLVLIESGGYKNDPEKQYLRKMNFIAILTSLVSIADGTYTRENHSEYEKIPQNERNHFDLIIRNARTNKMAKPSRWTLRSIAMKPPMPLPWALLTNRPSKTLATCRYSMASKSSTQRAFLRDAKGSRCSSSRR
ncbi:MAG: hypothetical protein R2822_04245 [Spirosomataceae bacterium]